MFVSAQNLPLICYFMLVSEQNDTDYFGLLELPHSGSADLTPSYIFSSKRAASVSEHSH